MISALFVKTNGCYFNLPGIDPWDEKRDARLYTGVFPVIAHPPCQRWGKMWMGQPLWVKKTGQRKIKGDDDGCFKSALDSVRRCYGIIEHPWGSHAWNFFGLKKPSRNGGWIRADDYGFTCCVEQGRYGHYARKPTLLYCVGCDLPELEWGIGQHRIPEWAIEKYGLDYCKKAGELAFKGGGKDSGDRIDTPIQFRDLLISIVRTAKNDKR